jgi:hypothetical protein
MLLIAVIALAAVWGAVLVIVLGLCVSAAGGDRELLRSEDLPQAARVGGTRFLRSIAG